MKRRQFLLVSTIIALGALAFQAQSQTMPADQSALEAASRDEKDLIIYSNLQISNWQEVLKGFGALYPWLEVNVVDLGAETFERYYAESASGGRGADMIVAGGADSWLEFAEKGASLGYVSSETPNLPDWSVPYPGIYTLATDPAVIIYNKHVIAADETPTSLHGVVELLRKRPELKNRITTQNVAVPFGRSANFAWAQHNPDAWDVFDELGQATRPERAVGGIIEKVTTGEYAVAWFVNASALFPKLRDPTISSIIGWSFITDGTPLVPRRVTIPKTALHSASAKLMLNYLVSQAGQTGLGKTGVTAYRADVSKADVLDYTYDAIVADVGAGNVALLHDDAAYANGRDAFLARWHQSFVQSK